MVLQRKVLSALFAISTSAASLSAQIPATPYEVVDIGALTGMPFSSGSSVSNSGFVAGGASNGVGQQGFNWHPDTGLQWLSHPFGGDQSSVSEVNDAGQVVGSAWSPNAGVLWNADGSVGHVFQSSGIDQPTDVNNLGQVSGYRNIRNTQSAYVWAGSYTDLGFPAPASSSQGHSINDAGQVAGHLNGGQAFGNYPVPAAFLWSEASGFTTILTSESFIHISVHDLSNDGTVVGSGYFVHGNSEGIGWTWNESTGYSELTTLPGAIRTDANAINDAGLIAGESGAFGTIWDQQGNIYKVDDLLAPNFSGWRVTHLFGINDHGWLTGRARPPGSENGRAVLLRPIPEPASLGLLGLAGTCALARRRPPRRSGGLHGRSS
jgi:hypothetical protein